jgi:type II secretory pathway pseudopilin PulG
VTEGAAGDAVAGERPAPAAPPSPRPRFRKTVRELAFEALLIVISILLALAVNEWAEGRKERRLAEQALVSFARELAQNRAHVAEVIPYHDTLAIVARRADSLALVHSYADWRREVPQFGGMHNPELSGTAWQTALATGALTNIGYDTVAALSQAYNAQTRLDQFTADYVPLFDFSDAAMASTARRAYVYFASARVAERSLLRDYDAALALLGPRRPGP